MGILIGGEWREQEVPFSANGENSNIIKSWPRHRIEARPEAPFPAESGRYHLYASWACPWSHVALILWTLKKLQSVISVSIVDPKKGPQGWEFSDRAACIPDTLYHSRYLYQVYQRAQSQVTARVTVPMLWDKNRQTLVSQHATDIVQMLDTCFSAWSEADVDFYPSALATPIEVMIKEIELEVMHGVYRVGFAQDQLSYDRELKNLFDRLENLEARLRRQPYLCGTVLTEADWYLFVTLLRFDLVYFSHFKCNQKRLVDFPCLWNYMIQLYQYPGIAETCHFDHIKIFYYWSQEEINPRRIVPLGPPHYVADSKQSVVLHEGKYLQFCSRSTWEYVERVRCAGAVVIIAQTPEGEVLFVEQYRVALGKNVIELPAGLVGDLPEWVGEAWEQAARRELLEETGYMASRFSRLTEGPVSPGMSTERVAFYLAEDLQQVGPGGGDESESIHVHRVPLAEVPVWLESQGDQGKLVDPKVYVGLFFLSRPKT